MMSYYQKSLTVLVGKTKSQKKRIRLLEELPSWSLMAFCGI